MEAHATPAISVVICTLNRPKVLRETMRQVVEQPFRNIDLIIIDQSNAAEAQANKLNVEALADDRVSYCHISRQDLPNARNEGLRRALAAIVLFLDDDVILLRDDFMVAHIAAYDDPSVGGVTGRHVERSVPMNARHTACYVSWSGRTVFNLFGMERVPIGACKGSNMSFRSAIFARIGGFDRRTEMLEDTDFSLRVVRAGWRLIFEPNAELVHLSTPSGGARQSDSLTFERYRFRSTSYFILKHRGLMGFIPFVFTFTAIAINRAARFRSLAVLATLFRSIGEGMEKWRAGADEDIEPLGGSFGGALHATTPAGGNR